MWNVKKTKDQNQQAFVADTVEQKLQILLKDGPDSAVDFNALEVEFPTYFDEKKFSLGQQIFHNNLFTMMVAKLCGLLTLLAIPTILDVIMFTKQSGTTCTAFRRYVSTIFHTIVWYDKKPSKESKFFLSLKNVHKKHCIAFRKSFEAGLRKPSQLDMALAQFGFIGFTLVSGKELGVHATREELDGLVHFWRVVGYMLGMKEQYNLCTGTFKETQELCRRLLDEVFLPSLATRGQKFDEMSKVLLEGLWPMNPYLDHQAFTTFSIKLITSAATNNNHSIEIDTSKMGFYSKFMLTLQLFVHRYVISPKYWWSAIFRAFFNGQMRFSLFLTEHFPFLAYWAYGRKRSHVNIYKYYVE